MIYFIIVSVITVVIIYTLLSLLRDRVNELTDSFNKFNRDFTYHIRPSNHANIYELYETMDRRYACKSVEVAMMSHANSISDIYSKLNKTEKDKKKGKSRG